MDTLDEKTLQVIQDRRNAKQEAERYAEQAQRAADHAADALNAAISATLIENGYDPEEASIDLRTGTISAGGASDTE